MSNFRVLITGANTGIGFATAKILVQQGVDLIIACRNADKAQVAQAALQQLGGKGTIDVVLVDLNSLASVVAAAKQVNEQYGTIDVLINNAGLYATAQAYTQDGFEQQIGVNYIGPFLFTQLLLPALKKAKAARIINLASIAHWFGSIKPETFRGVNGRYNAIKFYGQSKLANLLFSDELSRQLAGTGITINALHPGGIDSDIYRSLPKIQYWLLKKVLVSPDRPAKLITQMALSPEWASRTGQYVSAHMPDWRSKASKDAVLGGTLYQQTLDLLKDYL